MVRVVRIAGATRVMAEGQEEFFNLPIRDEEIKGINTMTSAWEFTPAEVKAIVAGAKLYLTILGKVHPPVMVKVEKV